MNAVNSSMKLLNILFSFFLINISYAQLTTIVTWTRQSAMPAATVIYYSPAANLIWENFQGEPVTSGNVAAMTVSGFGYNASVNTRNGKGILSITVYCYFDKNKSWVKPGKTTSYILTHEQHHFDISNIAANIFIDKLQNTAFTTANFNDLLPQIYRECCNTMNKMQNDYDEQTKNGQIKEEQVKWNNFIDQKISSIIN